MAAAESTISIEVEIKKALDRLDKLQRELDGSRRHIDRVTTSTRKMETAFKTASTAVAGFFAYFSADFLKNAADKYTQFTNAVKIGTASLSEQKKVQDELYKITQQTGTDITTTTKLYTRLRMAAVSLNSSQAETLKLVELVGKSMKASGTNAAEASGALLQFGQALNMPRVMAEEFNSMMEGMPGLMIQVERQLGITAGSLKAFVKEGKLSNREFADAILGAEKAINDQYNKAQITIGTSIDRIGNAFVMLIGRVEESTGFFRGLSDALTGIATGMDNADDDVRRFTEGLKLAKDALYNMKDLAVTVFQPIADAFKGLSNMILGENGTSPLLTGINYIRSGFGFLAVAAEYEIKDVANTMKLWGYFIKDFFMGIVYEMMSFFEQVDNFFLEQINNIISAYNYLAEEIPGIDITLSPLSGESTNQWQEIALQAEIDSQMKIAEIYKERAKIMGEYQQALKDVAAGHREIQKTIDNDSIGKVNQQFEDVDLSAKGAAEATKAVKTALDSIDRDNAFAALGKSLADAFDAARDSSQPLLARASQLTGFVDQINQGIVQLSQQGILRPQHFHAVRNVLVEMLMLSKELRTEAFQEGFSLENQQKYEDGLTGVFKLEKAITDQQKERDRLKYYTLFDGITKALREVLGLEEQITEEKEKQRSEDEKRVATIDLLSGNLVDGVAGAGPNASRGVSAATAFAQGAQAGGPMAGLANMALDMVMSNEKVAKAIDSSFKLFFDVFDPFIETIADLIDAINSLIGALLSAANDAISSAFENFNLTNGNATQYVEQALSNFGDFIGVPMGINHGYRGWDLDGDGVVQAQKALLQNIFEDIDTVFEEGFRASAGDPQYRGLLGEGGRDRTEFELTSQTIEDFTKSVEKIGFSKTMEDVTESMKEAFTSINRLYIHGYDKDKVTRNAKEVEAILTQLLTESYFENVAANILENVGNIQTSITEQIERIEFNALTAEQQFVKLHLDRMDSLEEQRIEAIATIEVEEHRVEVLEAIKKAEADSSKLLNKQKEELKLLNEERERESNLLQQQNSSINMLQKILKDFEKAMEGIEELVEGLFDQVTELLLSEFNLAPATDKLEIASTRYASLLEKAFDPDATEEDVENLQAFVNEYLKAARDVYKSSSTFQDIFASVLDDLSMLGVTSQFNMTGGAVGDATGGIKEFIEATEELDEGLRKTLDNLIRELNLLGSAFQTQTLQFITGEDGLNIPITLTSDDLKPIISEPIDLALTQDDIGSIGFFDADGEPLKLDFTETASFTASITGFDKYTGTSDLDVSFTGDWASISEDGLSASSNIAATVDGDVDITGNFTAVGNLVGFTKEDGTTLDEGATEGWATLIGNASFSSNLSGMGKTVADATEYYGYASFDTSLSGMGKTTYTAYYGYASFAAVMSGMSADVNNPASITGYVSAAIKATISSIDTSGVETTVTTSIQNMLDNIERTFTGLGQLGTRFTAAAGPSTYVYTQPSSNRTYGIQYSWQNDYRTTDGVFASGVAEGSTAHYASIGADLVTRMGKDFMTTNPYVITKDDGYAKTVFAYSDLDSAITDYDMYYGQDASKVKKYGFRFGGIVHPQDTIPAMLSAGEYILSPETVNRFGVGSLNRLNAGDASAVSQTNDPEVKRLLAELILAVKEQDSEVHVYTDMKGEAKAAVSEFRSELKERTRRQGDQFVPAKYI